VNKSKYSGKKKKQKLLGSAIRAGIRGDGKNESFIWEQIDRNDAPEELGGGIKGAVL